MFNFSTWVMSIVGIVMMTLVVDIIIPEGQTNKYIKSIFSLLTVFVIASPLPGLIKSDFNIADVFAPVESVALDENFLQALYSDRVEVLEKKAVDALSAAGVTQIKVTVAAENENNYPKIINVLINLEKVVIKGQPSNININEYVIQTVSSVLGIEAGKVVVIA